MDMDFKDQFAPSRCYNSGIFKRRIVQGHRLPTPTEPACYIQYTVDIPICKEENVHFVYKKSLFDTSHKRVVSQLLLFDVLNISCVK